LILIFIVFNQIIILVCDNLAYINLISGAKVSMVASSAVDRGFESRLGQTKDYKIGICCFSTKHAALMSKTG
jgi:hypothetical protein